MDLGRKQWGQVVNLRVLTINSSDQPSAPDNAPVVVVTKPDSTVQFTAKMAMDGGSLAFALPILLGVDFALGIYGVSYTYSVGGFEQTASDTFTLIPGGDPGGNVISMMFYDRPESSYVLAQLANGRLVQGRNPTL